MLTNPLLSERKKKWTAKDHHALKSSQFWQKFDKLINSLQKWSTKKSNFEVNGEMGPILKLQAHRWPKGPIRGMTIPYTSEEMEYNDIISLSSPSSSSADYKYHSIWHISSKGEIDFLSTFRSKRSRFP